MNWITVFLLPAIYVAETAASSNNQVFLVSFFGIPYENHLFFTSCDPGTCSISYDDGSRKSQTVTLPGDDVVSVPLPTSTHNPYGVHRANKAILVNCTVPTSVFAKSYNNNRANDACVAVPIGPDFTDYIVPSVPVYAGTGLAALYSNTRVTIALNSTCNVNFTGSQFSSGDAIVVVLDALEVIVLEPEVSNCDMGGTRISSNRPIAVYSGTIPIGDYNFYSLKQIFPTGHWGSKFVVPGPQHDGIGQFIRVTALDDATSVSLASFGSQKSNVTVQLESSDHHDVSYDKENVIITSTKPIQIIRYMAMGDSDYGAGNIIHGYNTYKTNYTITTMDQPGIQFNSSVNIVTSKNCDDDIVVNGKSTVSLPLSWTRLGSSNFSVGTVAVPPGPVHAWSRSGMCSFSLEIHGYGSHKIYAYSAFQDCHHLDHSYTTAGTTPLSYRPNTTSSAPFVQMSSVQPVTKTTSSEELLNKAISLTCSHDGWLIDVDLDLLKQLYPNIDAGSVFLSEDMCTAHYDPASHVARFNVTYGSCKTDVEEKKDEIAYKNFLFYPEVTSNVMTAINWRYDLDCRMKRQESVKITFNPSLNALLHGHSSGQLSVPKAHLKFYTDGLYQNEITGNPLSVNVGSHVYVELSALVQPENKMVVEHCSATPAVSGNHGNPLPAYPLITNKCPAEITTHLLSTSRDTFHFSFQALQFRQQHGDISVSCHVHLCLGTDTNPDCTQSCTSNDAFVP